MLVATTGIAMGIPGCALSPQKRLDVINDQANKAEARADRVLAKKLAACHGDPVCEQNATAEYGQAMSLLQSILDARINGELQHAQDAEDAWDQWLRDLPEVSRKFWEQLSSFIERMKELSVKSEGLLQTSGLRVLVTEGASGSSGGSEPRVLTPEGAASNATSMLASPGSWEELFRLQISGNVDFEFSEGSDTTLTTGVFQLEGNYDGELNPGESIGLTGGTVQLFDGDLVIRLSSVVGASNLRIFNNGNGYLRIAGFTDYDDEWNDTDESDQITLEIPVRLEGQSLRMSTGGEFMPGNLLLWKPRTLISDYNNDGFVNAFDASEFSADYNAAEGYADVNEDGVVDIEDMNLFLSEYQDVVDWNQSRTDWRTAP